MNIIIKKNLIFVLFLIPTACFGKENSNAEIEIYSSSSGIGVKLSASLPCDGKLELLKPIFHSTNSELLVSLNLGSFEKKNEIHIEGNSIILPCLNANYVSYTYDSGGVANFNPHAKFDISHYIAAPVKAKNLKYDIKISNFDKDLHYYSSLKSVSPTLQNIDLQSLNNSYSLVTKSNLDVAEINGVQVIYDRFSRNELEKILQLYTKLLNRFGGADLLKNMFILESNDGFTYLNGVNLDDTIVAEYQAGVSNQELINIISHEFTHFWIPTQMGLAGEKYPRLNWFIEGFTEYYSVSIQKEMDFISESIFLDTVNEYLDKNQNSIFSKLSLDEYENIFNNTPAFVTPRTELDKMPYWRGFLIAFILDKNLEASTSRNHKIYKLVSRLINSPGHLDSDKIFSSFSESVRETFKKLYLKHIVVGRPVTVNDISNCVEYRRDIKHKFNLGYNVIRSQEDMRIEEIDINSEIYKFGIRNGDSIVGSSFSVGDHTEKANLAVISKQSGMLINIEYMPSQEVELYTLTSLKSSCQNEVAR
ncbi:hypothetical protein VT06_16355 [Arsukibacterium sp. MJ3]|uniref:M61 family metallopeptidase n=1 Tax=Arsukibacterium sp. MJ3 TaxID=1632859 RepID=UPI0006273BD6|nr:hypothetical protein [Arsukibacterium sp. MJ3]KKO47565.1 hypothetical protein VT06_16355 [Arsukibacterium sp. MJ3]